MSDYLDNLVARTLNLAPVVRPRLGSVFEPVSITAGQACNALREVETESELAAAESTSEMFFRPLRISLAQQPSPAPAELGSATILGKDRNTQTNNREQAAGAFTPPASVAATAGHVFSQRATAKSNPVRIIPLSAAAPAPDGKTESADSIGEELDYETWPRLKPRVRPLADQFNEFQVSHAKDREHAEAASTSLLPESISAQISNSKNSIPVFPIQSFNAQPLAPTDQPKSIRVTIGRVDVRAVFPPPTATRTNLAEKRSAAMSLDEYLKQRSEGRR